LTAGVRERLRWRCSACEHGGAGLLLTTEVMIAEAPKEDDHAHGAPGGGMGGMEM
jgi:hypothetical protein